MEYGKAKNIRQSGLSTLIKRRVLDSNQSFTKATVGAISDKFKAKMTGLQEKLDPLNIAKKLTGGSNLAPALLGKMTGRKLSSIRYFTGSDTNKTYKSLGPVGTTGENVGSLESLYSFIVKTHEQDKKRYALERSFREEQRNEDRKNHEQFVEVLKMYTRMPLIDGGTTVVEQKAEVDQKGLLTVITEKFTELTKWIANMFSKTGPIALFATKIYDWFKDNIGKSIGNFLKNNITKYLTKTVMLQALKTGMGFLWTVLTNPVTIAALIAAAGVYAASKFGESQTGLRMKIHTAETNYIQAEKRLETYKKQGYDDSHYLVVGAKRQMMDEKNKLEDLTYKLQGRAQADALQTEEESKDEKGSSLYTRISKSLFGDTSTTADADEKMTPFPEFNLIEEPKVVEKTATKVEAPVEPVEKVTPTKVENRVVQLPPALKTSDLSKVIQEAGELEMKGYAVDQTTGSPVMFNNVNTQSMPDKVPSTPASVRDNTFTIKKQFDYLRTNSRAY